MLRLVNTKKTLKNFLEASYASNGQVNNTFKTPLSYIGTYYESNFIPGNVLAEPNLNIEVLEGKDIHFELVLKPEPSQIEMLTMADNYLQTLSKGFFGERPEKVEAVAPTSDVVKNYLTQNSFASDVQNYPLHIYLNEPEVYRQDTVINGVPYIQYTLIDRYDFGNEVTFEHKVHCLFKEKTSEGENFFSALVGKELSKKDAKKVLDILSDKNITGFLIGGYMFGKPKEELAKTFAIGSELEMTRGKYGGYTIKGGSSSMNIPEDNLKNLVVTRVSDFRYNISVQIDNLRLLIFIG